HSSPLSSCLARAPPATQSYTLSLHDALPIYSFIFRQFGERVEKSTVVKAGDFTIPANASMSEIFRELTEGTPIRYAVTIPEGWTDRKSTRLNSSHVKISYAVFCLKKKNIMTI